jgi:hypothetical protein
MRRWGGRRAEAVADTFNAQEVANTLWAFATMERASGAAVMRMLEERAEALADTFNAQEVANTLYKCAKMGREPGDEGAGEAGGGSGVVEDPPLEYSLAYKLLPKMAVRSLPAEAGCYERNRGEVMEFVETMRSDGSLTMNLRLNRKRAVDEDACAVKKAPNQDAQR